MNPTTARRQFLSLFAFGAAASLAAVGGSCGGAMISSGSATSPPAVAHKVLIDVRAEWIHADDNAVFWLAGGEVFRADPSGRSRTRLAQINQEHEWLSVGAEHVYWVAFERGSSDAVLARVPRRGGAVETLATLDAPSALVVDGATAYVAATGRIVAFEDGREVEVIGEQADRLAADEGHLYYLLEDQDTVLARVAKGGGESEVLHRFDPGLTPTGDIVVANGSIWTTVLSRTGDRILRIPTGGGEVEEMVRNGHPTSIAVDAQALYFTGQRTYRRDHATGHIVTLGAQICAPRSIALAAGRLYGG